MHIDTHTQSNNKKTIQIEVHVEGKQRWRNMSFIWLGPEAIGIKGFLKKDTALQLK